MSHTPLPTPSSPLLSTSDLRAHGAPARSAPAHPGAEPEQPRDRGTRPQQQSRPHPWALLPRPCPPHPEGPRGCEAPEQEEENHPVMGVLGLIGNDDVK